MELARGVCGLLVFVGLAWLLSEQRRPDNLRPVAMAVIYQFAFAVALTHVPAITTCLGAIAHGVDAIQGSAADGARFVFGYLAGGPQPYAAAQGSASSFIFAFQALPAILLVSGLSALLWHWRILQLAVRGCAWVFGRLFGVSGPVGVSTSACIFLGMVEAPLLVRPLLPRLSRGDLFIIMVDGMSVVAGSTMILLASVISPRMPDAFVHLLTASLVSTPMAIAMARVMVPSPADGLRAPLELSSPYRSSLDALTSGTISAIHMAANVAALLIVFVGVVGLVNRGLANFDVGGAPLSLGMALGWLFSPVAWLMGVPAGDYATVGSLLGTKVTTNEVVAFGQFAALPAGTLSSKGALVVTYALASFGNLGSVAILIGMLTAVIPDKADEIIRLGPRALAAAFLTSCMTGTVIGLLDTLL
ncbi:MAG: nucleoside transporter C-terminal domain-containing protein [Novosphingobium sp.]